MKAFSPILQTLLPALAGQILLAQSRTPWTLWPGIALMGWALWRFSLWPERGRPPKKNAAPLSPWFESILFTAILLLGLFFRTYHLETIPPGLPADQGSLGLSALRILHDGWRPFYEAYRLLVPEPLTPYLIAAWFQWVGPSLLTLKLFFVLLSLAAFPFAYWFFRQLAGLKIALLSLFFLAVSRWQWTQVRDSQPSLAVPLFLFATLALFLYGIRTRRFLPLVGAALFCGLGLYSYQSCKAIPILLGALTLFEWNGSEKKEKDKGFRILGFFLILLFLASPLLLYMAQNGALGRREASDLLLNRVIAQKSLLPILKVWGGTALMFNRQGDPSPWYNFSSLRMLDDLTGILFLFGIASAWRSRGTRAGLYPLAGSFVMALPGLLSITPAASHRLLGLTPFVAYFAALAGIKILENLFPLGNRKHPWLYPILGISLLAITIQNTRIYFGLQAKDPAYQAASAPAATALGQAVQALDLRSPGSLRFYLSPDYLQHPTFSFLTYGERGNILKWDPIEWAKSPRTADKDATIFLEDDKRATLGYLEGLFPGLLAEERIPGSIHLEISRNSLAQAPAWKRGLKGAYIPSEDWSAPPALVQVDPVLDVSSAADLPFPPTTPLRARWTGSLKVPQAGYYFFQVLTRDPSRLWLDGKRVLLEKTFWLSRGGHSLELEWEKGPDFYPVFHFIWKRPGQANWEAVPASAFGKIP